MWYTSSTDNGLTTWTVTGLWPLLLMLLWFSQPLLPLSSLPLPPPLLPLLPAWVTLINCSRISSIFERLSCSICWAVDNIWSWIRTSQEETRSYTYTTFTLLRPDSSAGTGSPNTNTQTDWTTQSHMFTVSSAGDHQWRPCPMCRETRKHNDSALHLPYS